MDNPFDSVKDSSIWFKPSSLKTINTLDTRLYIGVVREAHNDVNTNELRYLVEIHHKNDVILSNCRMLRRYGGAYNYEDFVLHGYNYNNASDNQNGSAAVPGDVVLVGQFAGQGREGVILGGLTHVARKSFLDVKKGPQYKSEFNGIETSINEEGEWTVTFKGQPINKDKLDESPSEPVPAPEYDKDVGTSYLKWDKTGSFTVSDEATDSDGKQRFFIDKKNGAVNIEAGSATLKITKSDQVATWTVKEYVVHSDKVRLGEEGASEALVIGTTFRDKQKTMNGKVKDALKSAQSKLLQAKIKLTLAGSAMSVPISGAIAAGPNISQAATSISDAGDALNDAASAIGDFESGATDDYLSKVSKTK